MGGATTDPHTHTGGFSMSKRVVITGMGVVHSLGCDVNTFWQAVRNGENGISTVTRFDVTDFPTKVAA